MGEAAVSGEILPGGEGDRRAQRDGRGGGVQVSKPPPSALRAASSPPAARNKLSYKDQRDYDRLPAEIERLEAEVAADEAALHDPDLYARDPDRFPS